MIPIRTWPMILAVVLVLGSIGFLAAYSEMKNPGILTPSMYLNFFVSAVVYSLVLYVIFCGQSLKKYPFVIFVAGLATVFSILPTLSHSVLPVISRVVCAGGFVFYAVVFFKRKVFNLLSVGKVLWLAAITTSLHAQDQLFNLGVSNEFRWLLQAVGLLVILSFYLSERAKMTTKTSDPDLLDQL